MKELFHLADELGITVEYCSIPQNESLSVQDEAGDFVLMDYSLLYADARERTHLAHELGHCVTGSFYNRYAPQDVRQKHENRADKWAIHKLIAADELHAAVADGHTEVWDLADYFGVTEDLMKKAICYYAHGNLATELYF